MKALSYDGSAPFTINFVSLTEMIRGGILNQHTNI